MRWLRSTLPFCCGRRGRMYRWRIPESAGFGLFLVYRIGFVGGLFTGEYRWTPQWLPRRTAADPPPDAGSSYHYVETARSFDHSICRGWAVAASCAREEACLLMVGPRGHWFCFRWRATRSRAERVADVVFSGESGGGCIREGLRRGAVRSSRRSYSAKPQATHKLSQRHEAGGTLRMDVHRGREPP